MAISKRLWSHYSKPSDGLNLGSAWLRNSLGPRWWQHQLSDRLLCLVRSSLVLAPSSVVGHQAMLVPCGPVWSAGIRSMLGCLRHTIYCSCAFDPRIHLMHDCMTADLNRPLRGVIVTRYCMTVQYVSRSCGAASRQRGSNVLCICILNSCLPPIVFLQCLCHRLPLILPA